MTPVLPRAFRVLGWLFYPGAVLIGMRLLWEETFLTWERGPQMVGFSIMHTGGVLVLVALASLVALQLWLVPSLVWLAWSGICRRRPTKVDLIQVALVAATVGLFMVPYGFWQWIGIQAYGPGGHAGSYLVHAAARGDFRLLDALLAHGVSINTREPNGSTALSGAAVVGHLEMVRFLVDHGAEVNLATDILNRTPLMNAAEVGRLEVVRYLLSVGADPTLRDAEGQTAADIAARHHHLDIAAHLGHAKVP